MLCSSSSWSRVAMRVLARFVLFGSLALLYVAQGSSIVPWSEAYSEVLPGGHRHLVLVDRLRATVDTHVVKHGPSLVMVHPPDGAVLSGPTTEATFKFFIPWTRSVQEEDTSVCFTVSRMAAFDEPGLAGVPTCLVVVLDIEPSTRATNEGASLQELEGSQPLVFGQAEGYYNISIELRIGERASGMEAVVYVGSGDIREGVTMVADLRCPLKKGEEAEGDVTEEWHEQSSQQLMGLDMPVGGDFGWGVAGLNIAMAMLPGYDGSTCQADNGVQGQRVMPVPLRSFSGKALSPAERSLLEPCMRKTASLVGYMETTDVWLDDTKSPLVRLGFPVVHASLGPFSNPAEDGSVGVQYMGTRNAVILFLENTTLPASLVQSLHRFEVVLAGSTWLSELLAEEGLPRQKLGVFWQCVDYTLFHPPTPNDAVEQTSESADVLRVFSGGKLEFRKGQDIVVAAMKELLSRHGQTAYQQQQKPRIQLVTLWHNAWLDHMKTIVRSPYTTGHPASSSSAHLQAWLEANGLPATHVTELGRLSHEELARVLREEVDVALFPNRCEGGTNLVAMEAVASGVPVILSNNTGHADLIAMTNSSDGAACYVLSKQRAVVGEGAEGWGESDVMELVHRVEEVYSDRKAARERGQRAARRLRHACRWENSVEDLVERLFQP